MSGGAAGAEQSADRSCTKSSSPDLLTFVQYGTAWPFPPAIEPVPSVTAAVGTPVQSFPLKTLTFAHPSAALQLVTTSPPMQYPAKIGYPVLPIVEHAASS